MNSRRRARTPVQSVLRQAAGTFANPPVTRTTTLRSQTAAVKSPLRYPGGKSRAVNRILRYIPRGLDTLASPFLGGGSVELACAANGVRVYGYDGFEPLVDFWQAALEDAPNLARLVYEYHPLTRTRFYALQKRYFDLTDRIERAAAFFTLNRSSYSGTTLSGGMSPGHPRFNESAIERLANFRQDNLTVERADFKESLSKHRDHFLYLDPPYANGGKLYGKQGDMHEDFDHEGLADILRGRGRWVLSYNDCERVRDLYPDNPFITPEWTYGMSTKKESNEVLILGDDCGITTMTSRVRRLRYRQMEG